MQDIDLYWLAGLMEGEGSFMKGPPSMPHQPCVSLQMTDEDIVSKASSLVNANYFKYVSKNLSHKDSYKFYVRGLPAVKLMELLKPFMGSRRQAQIEVAINCYKLKSNDKIPKKDYESIIARRKNGESARQISEDYGVTKWAIYRLEERYSRGISANR